MQTDFGPESDFTLKDGLKLIGVIGGITLFAHVLSEGGPPRRSPSRKTLSSKVKLEQRVKKDSPSKETKKKITETKRDLPTATYHQERKWPLEYYSLSKNQQYKYRLKMKKGNIV
jgi:hypothetical protein